MDSNARPLVERAPGNERGQADFRVGNSMFSDDVWDFKGFVDKPHWNDAKFKLDFTHYLEWDSVKKTIKQYIASEVLANTLTTARRKLDAFVQVRKFLATRPDIVSFEDFDTSVLRDYYLFLLQQTSERGTPLSGQSIKKSAQVVMEVLLTGGVKGWEVPADTRHVQRTYEEMILNDKFVKKETKFGETKRKLPKQEIFSKLIEIARKDEDVITGASIILSTQLGLRIGEVVTIEEDCLQIINGEWRISYTTSKTTREAVRKDAPANELVVEAVNRLRKHTQHLRDSSGLPYLFLTQYNGEIVHSSYSNWEKNRLRPFIKKHDIRDETGALLKLSHHVFRHFFITYAIKNGMKIHDVSEFVNHKSVQMSEVYNHAQEHLQEQAAKILSGEIPVSGTNKMVLEAIESDANPFRGKTTEQVDLLRKAHSIEILPHGVCMHHPMRGEPCAQDGVCLGCKHFLAPASMLPQYEARLNRVNQELEQSGNKDGIYVSKLRYQAERLDMYVKDLKRKISERSMKQAMQEVATGQDEQV